jgi:hypothetical protein
MQRQRQQQQLSLWISKHGSTTPSFFVFFYSFNCPYCPFLAMVGGLERKQKDPRAYFFFCLGERKRKGRRREVI